MPPYPCSKGAIVSCLCASLLFPGWQPLSAERVNEADDQDGPEALPRICKDGILLLDGDYKVTSVYMFNETCTLRGISTTKVELQAPLHFLRDLRLEGDITFSGLSLSADSADPTCLQVEGNVEFAAGHLHFQNCGREPGGDGGAMRVRRDATFTDGSVRFQDCKAATGGCLYVGGSMSLNESNVEFHGGWADGSGGAVYVGENWTQTGGAVAFHACTAESQGGAAFVQGSLIHSGGSVLFHNCSAGIEGGAAKVESLFNMSGGSIEVKSCSAGLRGGGMHLGLLTQTEGKMIWEGCVAPEGRGGALYTQSVQQTGGEMLLQNCSAKTGGALTSRHTHQANGTMTFRDCFAEVDGGAALVLASLNQTGGRMIFERCRSLALGGALKLGELVHEQARKSQRKTASCQLDGSVEFRECSALLPGSSLYSYGDVQLNGSVVFSNCDGGIGGIMFTRQSINMSNAVFVNSTPPLLFAREEMRLQNLTVLNSDAHFEAGAKIPEVSYMNCSMGWEVIKRDNTILCSQCPEGKMDVGSSEWTVKESNTVGRKCVACPGHTQHCRHNSLLMDSGFMVEAKNLSKHLHCPNPLACPGGSLPGAVPMCEHGYVGTGCLDCDRSSHARSDSNIFKCVKCKAVSLMEQLLELCRFAGMDVIVFTISARSAIKNASRERRMASSVILNQFMSFGTVAMTLMLALSETSTVKDLVEDQAMLKRIESLVDISDTGRSSARVSAECLLGYAGRAQTLMMSCLLIAVTPMLLMLALALIKDSWLSLVVGMNCFLHKICAAASKGLICYRVEAAWRGGEKICMVEHQAALRALIVFCFVAAPISWISMVHREPSRTSLHVNYLAGAYKPTFAAFETERLVRKMLLMTVTVVCPITLMPSIQLLCVTLTLLSALVLHLKCRPYLVPKWNLAETCLLTVALVMTTFTRSLLSAEMHWSTDRALCRTLLFTTAGLACVTSIVMLLWLAKVTIYEKLKEMFDIVIEDEDENEMD